MSSEWVRDVRGLSFLERLLLRELADRANGKGWCFPSLSRMCADIEASRQGVLDGLATLVGRHLISRVDEPERGDLLAQVKAKTPRAKVTRQSVIYRLHRPHANGHDATTEPLTGQVSRPVETTTGQLGRPVTGQVSRPVEVLTKSRPVNSTGSDRSTELTRIFKGKRKERKKGDQNLSLVPPPSGDRENGRQAPEPAPANTNVSPICALPEAFALYARRTAAALTMRVPYGEVRTTAAQRDAMLATGSTAGADIPASPPRPQPHPPVRTVEQQIAALMAAS